MTLHALVDEAAIRRVMGGSDVMVGELRYLLAAMKRPNVTLHVIPFEAGAYGTMAGGVTILTFDDEEEPDVVYLEYPRGGEWIENDEDVEKFSIMLEDTRALALSVEESTALIKAQLRKLEGR
jgi:hypothetical protein